MKPKYKSKMGQKQRERAQANRADSKESDRPKITRCGTNEKLTGALQNRDIGRGERAGSHVY
jgi:hypothetical protein